MKPDEQRPNLIFIWAGVIMLLVSSTIIGYRTGYANGHEHALQEVIDGLADRGIHLFDGKYETYRRGKQ